MDLDSFPQAEQASKALGEELARPLQLAAIRERLMRGGSLVNPGSFPAGPRWKGRPVSLLDSLSLMSTEAQEVSTRLLEGTEFPLLKSLSLYSDAFNATVAGWSLPQLEELTVCGPHVPPGVFGEKVHTIPEEMFAHMPRLMRLHIIHFRALPEAVFGIQTLRSLDLSQELANPVFHEPPEPGLRLEDILRLRQAFPGLLLAFGVDVCQELPVVTGRIIDELQAISSLLRAGRFVEVSGRAEKLSQLVEAHRALVSDVVRLDLYAQRIFVYGNLVATTRGETRKQHRQRVLALSEEALAWVGDPAGWLISSRASEACRDVVIRAANQVGWHCRQRDPARALRAIEMGVAAIGARPHSLAAPVADTQARILLKLGRSDEAFAAARRGLNLDPDFKPLRDIKRSREYQDWLLETPKQEKS